MRILLTNHWHDDNRGDSAITQGILDLLHQALPGAELTVTTLWEPGELGDGGDRHLRRLVPDLTIRPCPVPTELRGSRRPRSRARVVTDLGLWTLRTLPSWAAFARGRADGRWRRLVEAHDLVVLVGGSNVFDAAAVPAAISVTRLLQVLGPVRAAVDAGRPVVLLGHTLGPFDHRVGARLARRMCAGADLAVVRERRSLDTAAALGAREAVELPDMAFGLLPRHTPAVTAALSGLTTAPARTLALSVRTHPTAGPRADERLIAQFAEAGRRLVDEGVVDGIVVVPHTTGPTPVEDDRGLSDRLLRLLPEATTSLMDRDLGPTELAAFYGSLAAVAAVRLHACILALSAGTPAFAVAYLTGKTHGVMAQVGLPDAVAEFTTVTADDVVAGIRGLLAQPGLRERLLGEGHSRREALAAEVTGRLRALVAAPTPSPAGGLR